MDFENLFWFNNAFNSVTTQLYLLLPEKFFSPPNPNLNIKMQTVSLPSLSGLLFILHLLLCWNGGKSLCFTGKALLRRKKKSRAGLVLVWRKCSTQQKWKVELKPHVFLPVLEEFMAQNLFWQALMSYLHFGHGRLRRAFHSLVKRTTLTRGDRSAPLCQETILWRKGGLWKGRPSLTSRNSQLKVNPGQKNK